MTIAMARRRSRRRNFAARILTSRGALPCRAVVRESVRPPDLEASGPIRMGDVAAAGGLRPGVRVPRAAAHRGHKRLPGVEGPIPGAAIRTTRQPFDDYGLHAPFRPGDGREGAGAVLLTRGTVFVPLASLLWRIPRSRICVGGRRAPDHSCLLDVSRRRDCHLRRAGAAHADV
jgi:hypothetical protein